MNWKTARSWTAALLVIPLLAGCPRKQRGTEELGEGEEGGVAQDYAVPLSVVAVSPATIGPNTPTRVTVRGGGFTPGDAVYVGTQQATSVAFQSDSALDAQLPGLPEGRYDVQVVNAAGQTSTLRQGLLVEAAIPPECQQVTVYFDLAQDSLRAEDAQRLTERLPCWTHSTGTILIEGHADERGTTDFNLALGDRRAHTVAEWLTRRGVQGTRIDTVSYGEERPADPGTGEAAWAKNRRAVVLLRK